ncbi:helix-turn-helix domain-containing protein [Nonomuraea fuscirosea]|jgi:DNA-binding PucR family transcriptional regulator|uniref:PucR family transcriptional regulator n=1 Tax=Nonomuraea fuscirosea TaxID=1291556 RepID=UPI002DD934B0|nr:helix-turn-helix domain-containing protein [Nonomuraea fuscirosea]WSA55982.1 helix-turn-helix domain-containing protein [Nonomuraea fuscirosea]
MAVQSPFTGRTSVTSGSTEIIQENRTLRDLVEIYRHLSGLALQDADIATVAHLIAQRTDVTVAVISHKMGILAAASPGQSDASAFQYVHDHLIHPRLAHMLVSAGKSRQPLRLPDPARGRARIVAPILVGDTVPAYLVSLVAAAPDQGEDIDLLIAEHAATICGVILARERVFFSAASQVRDDLVEGLLSGSGRDNDEVTRWAQHLGYDTEREHRVLSIILESPASDTQRSALVAERAAGAAARLFLAQSPDAITSVRTDEVVVVLTENTSRGSTTRAEQLGTLCMQRLGALFPDVGVSIGVGGAFREPAHIARSYEEARRTIEVIRRLGRRGAVVAFDKLGISRLLLQVPDIETLREFATDILGEVLRHEKKHHSEYIATLICYFQENNSPQRASKLLHVHPNTVTYRIHRIEEITGLDLNTYRDRLAVQVALEIIDALEVSA